MPHAFLADGLRNDDDAALDRPPQGDLGDRLVVRVGDADKRRVGEEAVLSFREGAPGLDLQHLASATAAAQLAHAVRFHDLPHAHAFLLLAGGADIQTVKARLGHGSLRTTEKYLHTLPDTDNTALDALQRIRNRTSR